MAFITVLAKLNNNSQSASTSPNDGSHNRCEVSRRTFSKVSLHLLLAGAVLPLTSFEQAAQAQEIGQLPDGAKQFSQVISAQRQWRQVPDAFANGHEPDDKEWENLRTYLRAVYAVQADMVFLTKRFEQERKQNAQKTISAFKTAVKAMDKPAKSRDVPAFLQGQAEVASLFEQFFSILQEQTVGDMPLEL